MQLRIDTLWVVVLKVKVTWKFISARMRLLCSSPTTGNTPETQVYYTLATWASERGGKAPLDFETISKKVVFSISRGKNQISPLLAPPWKKFWENPLLLPPWKKSFRRPWLASRDEQTVKFFSPSPVLIR